MWSFWYSQTGHETELCSPVYKKDAFSATGWKEKKKEKKKKKKEKKKKKKVVRIVVS